MLKSGFTLTLLITAAIALSSCDSVLDETVVSGITADVHFTTEAGLRSAVNAAYQPMRDFFGRENGGNLTQYGTDETTSAGHGGNRGLNYYDATINADNGNFSGIWANFYQAINTTNVVVHRVDGIDGMTDAEKNEMAGEARYLRAFYYFNLVQFFGDIHLTLEETIGVETEARRDTAKDVYTAIVTDLEFAVANLPNSQGDYGRATKAAAEMLLGQVLLTRGYQSSLGGSAADFTAAAAKFENVVNNYGFALLDDYAKVFDHDGEINSEVIWSVQYTSDQIFNGSGNEAHLYFRPWYENIRPGVERTGDPGYGRPWIRFRVTEWALNNFGDLDVDSRYDKIFQTEWYYNQLGADRNRIPSGCAVGDLAIWIPDPRDSQAEIDAVRAGNCNSAALEIVPWTLHSGKYLNQFPSLMKHDDFKRGDNTNEQRGSRDFIIFRLAETHLLAAEAYFKAGQNGPAANHLNVVRSRAAYPGMESQMEITAGQVTLDFILDERTRELYGEYKRWLDLKRTGTLLERAPSRNPEIIGLDAHHLLRPIPTNQILRSSNEYGQNPGY